jgi:hypothetical protein
MRSCCGVRSRGERRRASQVVYKHKQDPNSASRSSPGHMGMDQNRLCEWTWCMYRTPLYQRKTAVGGLPWVMVGACKKSIRFRSGRTLGFHIFSIEVIVLRMISMRYNTIVFVIADHSSWNIRELCPRCESWALFWCLSLVRVSSPPPRSTGPTLPRQSAPSET